MGVTVNSSNKDFFKEFKEIKEFFSKSPQVLAEGSFISDVFVLMKNFLIAHPDNITAKLLFADSQDLYKKFGTKASTYFKFLDILADLVLTGETDSLILKQQLSKYFKSTEVKTLKFDSYGAFLDKGFDNSVLDAILEADGSYLDVAKNESAADEITAEKGFHFHIVKHQDFTMSKCKVFVLDTNVTPENLANFLTTLNEPTIVVCLGHSNNLVKFSELNDSPKFHLVEALPEYRSVDFESDLKRYVNQSVLLKAQNIKSDSVGEALQVICQGDSIRILSKSSFVTNIHIKSLMKQEIMESSPLIKQALQSRIHNMSGKTTLLKVGSNSSVESEAKLQSYITQILEVSYIILEGIVESNSLSSILNGISFVCFRTCFAKAIEDLSLAMSETRVMQN